MAKYELIQDNYQSNLDIANELQNTLVYVCFERIRHISSTVWSIMHTKTKHLFNVVEKIS